MTSLSIIGNSYKEDWLQQSDELLQDSPTAHDDDDDNERTV